MRRIPIIATLVVAAAVAVMIGLGIWQLQRAEWKEQMLADMREAQRRMPVDFDRSPRTPPAALLTRSAITCTIEGPPEIRGGRGRAGESGYRYLFPCTKTEEDGELVSVMTLLVDGGWSNRPSLEVPTGTTRRFTGTLYNRGDGRLVLTADDPLPPLQPSRPPSIEDIPNNHMIYAFQWFFFAAAAALIYALALRRRLSRAP